MNAHLANGGTPNWGTNWGAGDIMYANLDGKEGVNNGSNTLEDHGDLTIIGNSTPRYIFGLTLTGAWKGFDFSVFLQGVMKRDYWLDGPYFWGANGDYGNQLHSKSTWTIGVRKVILSVQTLMLTTQNPILIRIKTRKYKADIYRMPHIAV